MAIKLDEARIRLLYPSQINGNVLINGGTISYKTTNYTSNPILVYDDATTYGHTLLVGAGGTTYIGAGEAASTLYSKLGTKSSEYLILGADSGIWFYPGADSATSTSGVTLDSNKYFYPQTTNTGSIGTSSYKWGSMYATTFYGALSGNATSATKATQDASGNTITSKYVAVDTTQTISGAKTFSKTIVLSTQNYITVSDRAYILTKYSDFQYSSLTPSNTSGNEEFMKAALKAMCTKYPGFNQPIFLGNLGPNSQGPMYGSIYNTSTVDSTTGLPQYSTFWFSNLGGNLGIFGTSSYNYYYRTILDSSNYTSYTVTKTGSGASGNSWAIGITGNAATASAFSSTRTIALTGDVTGSTSSNGASGWSITTAVGDDTHNHTYSTINLRGSYTTATAPSSIPNAITYVELPSTATSTGDPTYGAMLTVKMSNNRGFSIGASGSAIVYRNYHSSSYGDVGYSNWIPILTSNNYTSYTVTKTGTGASGTWGISISGNAATADALTVNAGSAGQPVYFTGGVPTAIDWHIGNSSVGEHNCNNVTYNFAGYYTSNGPATSLGPTTNDGALWAQAYSSSWVAQMAQDYRDGSLYVRGKNSGTWTAWQNVILGNGYQNVGPIKLTTGDGANNITTNYISAGRGYSTGSGLNGLKLVATEQTDAISGIGQDCTGKAYELSIAAAVGTSEQGYITFVGHKMASLNTYSELGHFNFANSTFYVNGKIGVGTTSPTYAIHAVGDIYANGGWLRSSGNTGWYSQTHSGGWYMIDSTYVRSYNSKALYINNNIHVGTSAGSGTGLSLYSTSAPTTYGIHMSTTGNFGVHGDVQSDWATYFNMNAVGQRGWIYRAGTTNVASISANGIGAFKGIMGETGHIVSPDGGRYTTTTSTVTGYLKITLPVSWTNAMIRFTVDIYDYTNDNTVTYIIGGYNYSSSPGWHSTSAQCISKWGTSKSNLDVRFGHDGSKCAIYIGAADTSWSYPQVIVRDVLLGYGQASQIATWSKGWSIGFTTTLGSYIVAKSNTNVGYSVNYAASAGSAGSVAWDNVTGKPSTFTPASHTHNYAGSSSAGGAATSATQLSINNSASLANCLQYIQTSSQTTGNDLPSAAWHHVIKMNHGTGDTYYKRLLAFDFFSNAIKTSYASGDGAVNTWDTLLSSGNYSSYALPKSGGTLTGDLTFAAAKNINMTYSGSKVVLCNHNNGNVSLSALGSGLYVGYQNTTSIVFGASGAWGTMTSSGLSMPANTQISNADTGGSWISGRSNAAVRMTTSTSSSSFSPVVSSKTQLGSWDLGPCHPNEHFYFSYATDTNYNAGTNSTMTSIYFEKEGNIRASKVYGAVWNDYAEYRWVLNNPDTDEPIESGRCVAENGNDSMSLTHDRLQAGARIISDTYGMCMGETEKAKTPIAVCGRVLAYPFERKVAFNVGDPVCSGPNGTVSKMSREEAMMYPERIVGTVVSKPTYKEWGPNKIPVKGRIWIQVR